jgi:hypothetical protein
MNAIFNETFTQPPNYYELLFRLLHDEPDSEVKQNTASLIRMALEQERILTSDDNIEATLKRLDSLSLLNADWQQRAAHLDPMASYRIPLRFGGKTVYAFNINQLVGATGPASYVSEPRLTLCTLYPVNGDAFNVPLSSVAPPAYIV